MKKLLGLIFNRWLLIAVLLGAVSAVVWIVGPLVAIAGHEPLASQAARWTAIAALAGAALLVAAWSAWRARRNNAAVVNQLLTPTPGSSGPGHATEAESADLAAVRERFERALLTLRRIKFGGAARGTVAGLGSSGASGLRRLKEAAANGAARLGGRYLYELPWYLIIGAPGSGKTTALRNCGLKFPLADKVGEHALRGVGGTRHCDWWFTDQAVLIDTAGRFTTQDSDRDTDRATWSGFLRMLVKARPRQPVNGVLLTVSVPDLLTRNASERDAHAATVRARVQELQQDLGIHFPIYLLVTKCDLLAGFTDYFATLTRDARATPWGFTFALDGHAEVRAEAALTRPPDPHLDLSHSAGPDRLQPEFERLTQRLTNGLIERLQSERDPQRRASIYAFPNQFNGLRAPLEAFVDTVVAPSAFEAEPLLRGVYFISGTQEGTPIDRVLGAVARNYRLEHALLAPHPASAKSFFLTRLLSEVVFAESGVAGTNLKWERRRRQVTLAGYAALALVSAGAVSAWSVSHANNQREVAAVAARVAAVRQQLELTPNRNTPDLLPILAALEATRRLAQPDPDNADPETAAAGLTGFGLSQRAKLDSAARAAYGHMLVDAFQPRLALRVEAQLRQGGDAAESQYEALKTYLMLHDPTHADAVALKDYIERDWDSELTRQLTLAQRAQLSAHLDALLARGAVVAPVPADTALVATTRAQLASVALPQRIYNRMRQQHRGAQATAAAGVAAGAGAGAGAGAETPVAAADFSIVRAAGANATLVFARHSNRPLTEGVPGRFTFDGYHQGFQNEVGRVTRELSGEQGWVLGVAPTAGMDGDRLARRQAAEWTDATLTDAVRRLYLIDYAATWEAFIADIRVVPLTSLPLTLQTARLLSASDSPLPRLVQALAHETTLTVAPGARNPLEKVADQASGALSAGGAKVRKFIAATGAAPLAAPAAGGATLEATLVDERFRALRQFALAPDGAKAPVDATVALLGDLAVWLQAVQIALQGGLPLPPSPLPNQLKGAAAQAPQPVRGLLENLSDGSKKLTDVIQRDTLGKLVRAEIGEFCNQAIARRYPVDPRATLDATQADFAQLFGPGGRFDKLVNGALAPFIDTSARPTWRFRPVDGAALGSDTGTLAQFQRAAVIRETFFPAGAAAPALRLEFRPVEMDASISSFILDIDGQIVRYSHGPQIPTAVQWPGPRGSSQVRVQVQASGVQGGSAGMVTDGPWALLRMFDRVRIEPASAPERFRATFEVDARKAVFDVITSSVRNPFKLRELTEFACPQGL